MKLLFDENLSFKLCRELADLFPDSSQVRLQGLERESDQALWDYADRNGFALVTLDADFAELASLRGPPPKVIWLRSGNRPTAAVVKVIREYAEAIAAFEQDEAACLELY